jgi:8-oxo-dGTP pyrophosphatase MutT (NUDIX family)
MEPEGSVSAVSSRSQSMSQEEWVDWVDATNQVLMAVPRSRVRGEVLCHRATYIIIEDGQGRLYVQRRTLLKDYCPGMLDACCGGVVQTGEEYYPSALRELEEEMGIRGVALQSWGTFYSEHAHNKVWGALYSCHYEGELQLQASEVEYVLRMSLEEIWAQREAFMPDSLVALEQWQTRKSKP